MSLTLPIWAHLALFALSIVVPILGLVAWTSVEQARRDQEAGATLVARNLASELDRELSGLGGLLRALATSPAVRDGDLRRFHEQAVEVVPAGSAIVLRDRSGQQLVNTLFPFGTPLPVTTAPAVLAADECVFRTWATCASDLYVGTTDRQPYILLDAPVFRDGEVVFALNVALRASHLASLLSGPRTPPGWVVTILDRRDRIVARSAEHDRFVGGLANEALRREATGMEGSVRSVNVAGVPVWGAYVRLPAWDWRVAVGVPEALLAAPLRQSLLYLGGIGLLAIGLSVAAALAYGRRLARPIAALGRVAGEVGRAAVLPPIPTTIREVDTVAVSLAAASEALQASVAERDRAQEELRRLNEDLQARVQAEVAAREAAQAQLAHAQRMEALGQLAGGVAHDINNVLQAVGGGAALIERRPADPEGVRRLARMVMEAAERGSAVTRRLLAFSRRGDLRSEAVDPVALLADMREVLTHTLGAGIGVRVEASARVPAMLADKGQLETVIVNLAANARDAMDGAGTITLAAAAEAVEPVGEGEVLPVPKPGTYVRISIRDTGRGMTPEVLARAAEPFFTTKERGRGTGLGLAMARGFAEQSGGALLVASEPGRGTTVSLWLPIAKGAPAVRSTDDRAERTAGRPDAARRRVLLVDDDPAVREITAEGLEAAGFAVLPAADGAAALDLLDAGEAVDLIISDLSMPGMDGLAVLREAGRRRPGLPAILLTGFATNAAELAIGGAVSGAFSLLRKPTTPAALAERVAVMLEGTISATAAR